jgi:diguanylate cyclase (GGDEF)-like protein
MDAADSAARAPALEHRRLDGYAGLVGVEADGTIRFVSTELAAHFEVAIDEFVGRSFLEFVQEADVDQAIESFAGVAERGGHHQALEIGLKLGRGVTRVDVVADNRLSDPDIGLVLLNVADPDDRRRSVQLLDAQAEIVRQIALGGSLAAAMHEILLFVEGALPGFRAAAYVDDPRWHGDAVAAPSLSSGFTQRVATAVRMQPALPAAMALAEEESIIAADLTESRWSEAAELVRDEASCIWSVPIRYERGAPCVGIIEIYGPDTAHPRDEDWTILQLVSRLGAVAYDRVLTQERLVREAEIDPLTGTPNRRVLKSMLAALLAGDERGHVVCFIDLDQLKIVNDGLGHEAGDHVIREAARRLVFHLGDDGVVGRFGGDEFVVIANSPSTTPDAMARRCLDAFAEPVRVAGRAWQLSASIGVVVVDGQRTPTEVLSDADTAMYQAKRAGRGRWQTYESSARHSAARRLRLEQQLRSAVRERKISAAFQPVVRTSDWAMCGLETLARWEPQPGHWISPVEFIPLAEELGLIDELGVHMVDLAVEAVETLWSERPPECHVSVNVSPLQLRSSRIFEHVAATAHSDRASALCLEMTEQHMIDDSDRTLARLERLVELGVGLAVDDFGTGYSSLGALHRLPAQTLKIDRRLISQIGRPAGDAVLTAVVGVADAYGMTTVAEGVETTAQAILLSDLGIDRLQGYLFARPEPLAQVVARMARPGWCWDVAESAIRRDR